MSSLLPVMSEGFSRHPFQDGDRLLILSSCQTCAEAHINSTYDGSLQDWEQSHVCKAQGVPRGSTPNGVRLRLVRAASS